MKKNSIPLYKQDSFKYPSLFALIIIIIAICIIIISIQTEVGLLTVQNLISFAGILLTAITIIFLAINYKEQKEEIKRLTEDSEYNRLLDIVYRQFDISLPQIKTHSTYRTLNRIMNDFETDDFYRAQEIETHNDSILSFLINTKGLVNNFLFIIRNSNLELERKNFIRNIICNNLNNNFFWLFETFRNFCNSYPNDTFGMLEHVEEILTIKEELTD